MLTIYTFVLPFPVGIKAKTFVYVLLDPAGSHKLAAPPGTQRTGTREELDEKLSATDL